MPTDLLGPFGALLGAAAIVVVLWREHLAAVADVKAQRDKALEGWMAQTTATNRVADELVALRRDYGRLADQLADLERRERR